MNSIAAARNLLIGCKPRQRSDRNAFHLLLLLTLHSRRAGVRPIEVFIDDRFPIDPAMIERLDLVKKTNQGVQPLTPIGEIPTV